MDILAMHEMFRVLGQQMGLERVRGILEESIDVYLNAAIKETVANVVKSNVQTIYKDKITVQDNPISPINGVSTLYREFVSKVNTSSGSVASISLENVQYIFGFSISYPGETNYKQCRFIEPDRVDITLDDYCSRASKRYPIITIVSADENRNSYQFRIYAGNTNIDNLKVKYIKLPDEVSLERNINCDLPEHLHKDVVELAVQKYFNSVGSTSQNVR